MADRVATSIGVVAVLGIATVWFVFDARLKDAKGEIAALRDRATALEGRAGEHDAHLANLDARSQSTDKALDEKTAALDARLAASDKADETRDGQLQTRVDRIERDTARRAAAESAMADERKQLLADPGAHVKCKGVRIAKTSILQSDVHVTDAMFENTSAYCVADLRGTIEYRSRGQLLGTVPATASGIVLPGRTTKLSVATGDFAQSSDERETVFVVTSLAIVGGR